MTSVPKPLKFLAPHYQALKAAYRKLAADEAVRPRFADVLSVLAMVSDAAPMAEALARISKEENQGQERNKKDEDDAKDAAKAADAAKGKGAEPKAAGEEEAKEAEEEQDAAAKSRGVLAAAEAKSTRECLEFKLEGDPAADVGQWGHEYVRTLAGQVGREYQTVLEQEPEEEEEEEEEAGEAAEDARDARIARLTDLVQLIAPYCMAHNAEAEAVDLLMETQQLASLVTGGGIVMDDTTRTRVCLYLLRCADYLGDAEDEHEALHVALSLYLQSSQHADAARVALRMGSPGQVRRVLEACGTGDDGAARRLQIGFLLGRHGYRRVGYGAAEDDEEDEEDAAFASAAATTVGSALVGRGLGAAAAASSSSSSSAAAAALHSTLSSSSVAAHGLAMGRAGAVNGMWLPEEDELPTVARIGEEVKDAIGNATLSAQYRSLASALDLSKPRSPDEVFKTQTADVGARGVAADGARLDSARSNLAASYVSAFVNAGHGTDAVLYDTSEDGGEAAGEVFKWVNRNNADGRLAAASALGLIHLWDHEEGPIAPQPLVESADPQIVAGGALAVGVSCVGIATDTDVAKELLETYVDPDSPPRSQPAVVRSNALLGLSLAYAGTARHDVAAMLTPYVADTRGTWGKQAATELACVASLGLGFVFVGTGNADIGALIVARVLEASSVERSHPLFRQMLLGLGLVFQGRGAAADPALAELAGSLEGPEAREASILVTACAYAGTGNVLKAQEMLRACGEHPEADYKEKKRRELEEEEEAAGGGTDKGDEAAPAAAEAAPAAGGAAAAGASAAGVAAAAAGAGASAAPAAASGNPRDYQYQSMAAIALGVISMGEELGATMVERAAEHLMLYGDPAVRRAVPLTIAMCRISDPAYGTIDTLSKLSHDSDPLTAQSAILAMGLVGAGTNNSRLAGFLRQLATFHKRDQDHIFLVRIAQGLVAAGKGLVTLSPLHSDRVLVRPVAVAGVLAVALTSLDLSGTLLGSHHTLLHCLAPAILPRMVMTLDAHTREPVTVDVRIGTAVETVGQAGRPKTITGFQTHTTPALMNARDRAEVAAEEWEPVCSVLEGVVLLRKRDIDTAAGAEAAAARADKARAAAAAALARVPSKMAGIMESATGYGDD